MSPAKRLPKMRFCCVAVKRVRKRFSGAGPGLEEGLQVELPLFG